MNRAFLAAAVLAVTIVVANTPAEAQERQLTEERREQLAQQLEQIRTRLNLSEDQRAQLEPVLRRNFEQRAEVLRRYGVSRDGGERLGLRQARALRNDLDEVRRQNEAEIERILDSRQMAEYRKIQEEMRAAIRQRIREGRSSPTKE